MNIKTKETFCVSDDLCFFENEVYKVKEHTDLGKWVETKINDNQRYFGNKEFYEKFKEIK